MDTPAPVRDDFEKLNHPATGSYELMETVIPDPKEDDTTRRSEEQEMLEKNFLENQLRIDDVQTSIVGIYGYATKLDLVIVAICIICALAAGTVSPIAAVIGARIILAFSKAESSHTGDIESLLYHYVVYYIYLLAAALVANFACVAGFNYTAARITRAIKLRYFAAVLKQNLALFDDNGTNDILYQLIDDTKAVQTALSFKLFQSISAIASLIAATVVCFVLDWILMFELLWSLVFGFAVFYIGGRVTVRYSKRSIEYSAAASAVVDEALSAFKTTTSLGMQPYVQNKYMSLAYKTSRNLFLLTSLNSVLLAVCVASGYFNVALAFWQGSRRFVRHETSFTAVLAIANVTRTAAFRVLGVGNNIQTFTTAAGGISRLSRMIHRRPPIDSSSCEGHTPAEYDSTIELQGVKHIYPTRPKTVALNDVSVTFPKGKTIALVGHSGSGKSSISSLLMRFYDPVAGRILMNGQELTSFQLRWLRQQISVVKQESFMFNRSIYENIKLGLQNNQLEKLPEANCRELIYKAAEISQASKFIAQLPQGYDTVVGRRGSRLSGGQLQRVAIARALVGNPRILILDEATSALDTDTETRLLSSMSSNGGERTTIVIAHRLSTIRYADNIIVLAQGRVVENGTHKDLMTAKSHYYNLVQAQNTDLGDQTNVDLANESKFGVPSDTANSNEKLHSTSPVEGRDGLQTPEAILPSSFWSTMLFLFRTSKSEMHWPMLGFACCIIVGGEEPASAVLFGKAITALALPENKANQILSQTALYSWMFFLLASVMLVGCTVQGAAFALSAKDMADRLRSLTLQKYLKMDVAYFDQKEHSPAALTNFLSDSTNELADLNSNALGIVLICASTLISGIIVALILGWKLALVCFSVVPLVVGGGYLSIWVVSNAAKKREEFANRSIAFAGEALSGIQTIAALTREKNVLDEFEVFLNESDSDGWKVNFKTSILFAFSQAGYHACMALGFWYGGQLILRGEYTLFQAVAVQASMLLSANSAGVVLSWAPNLGKATHAATSLQRLISTKSPIDPSSPEGAVVETIAGDIEFASVSFAYPSNPDHPVLDKLSLRIPAGSHVAFVGETGSGKSTILSLIERFYDPTSGSIRLDSQPIPKLKLSTYRKCVAFVGQEPHLFSGTIRMNLTLGIDEQDSPDVTENKIHRACRDANIYDFVMSLPDGFNTEVGITGSQLSVGQKQRLVLARALLRNAKILLLDEATSALDSQSEVAIQQALENVRKERTIITVAHRLSTIARADKIYVIGEGRILESGSHAELLQAKGKYFRLHSASKMR